MDRLGSHFEFLRGWSFIQSTQRHCAKTNKRGSLWGRLPPSLPKLNSLHVSNRFKEKGRRGITRRKAEDGNRLRGRGGGEARLHSEHSGTERHELAPGTSRRACNLLAKPVVQLLRDTCSTCLSQRGVLAFFQRQTQQIHHALCRWTMSILFKQTGLYNLL